MLGQSERNLWIWTNSDQSEDVSSNWSHFDFSLSLLYLQSDHTPKDQEYQHFLQILNHWLRYRPYRHAPCSITISDNVNRLLRIQCEIFRDPLIGWRRKWGMMLPALLLTVLAARLACADPEPKPKPKPREWREWSATRKLIQSRTMRWVLGWVTWPQPWAHKLSSMLNSIPHFIYLHRDRRVLLHGGWGLRGLLRRGLLLRGGGVHGLWHHRSRTITGRPSTKLR